MKITAWCWRADSVRESHVLKDRISNLHLLIGVLFEMQSKGALQLKDSSVEIQMDSGLRKLYTHQRSVVEVRREQKYTCFLIAVCCGTGAVSEASEKSHEEIVDHSASKYGFCRIKSPTGNCELSTVQVAYVPWRHYKRAQKGNPKVIGTASNTVRSESCPWA